VQLSFITSLILVLICEKKSKSKNILVEIYCPYTSERLKYVLNYIFEERLGIHYTLVNDAARLDNAGVMRINYSELPIPGSLQIIPQGILSETGVKYTVFDLSEQGDASILLKKPENQLYFDIFSAVFYLISRYEEYLMFAKDKHHRFKYEDSCLYQGKCLQLPLVDIWIDNFRKLLETEFKVPAAHFRKNMFNVQPTLDIDSAFTYKGRSFFRQAGALIKNLILLRFSELGKRLGVLIFSKPDPNDNFDYQLQELAAKGLKATYFFQVGPYGTYDKNISPENPAFRAMIKKIQAAGHTIGLHPSYESNSEIKELSEEKRILESITGQPVTCSRQHYLRFDLPRTYKHLLQIGIREEYSMGYSGITGFRAGTAFPFYWFDLVDNQATELRIVPFSVMDVAYKVFASSTPSDTLAASSKIIEQLKVVEGPFCFVFHNESLSEHRGWQGWRAVFKSWLNG
jgi:hypothetical protein